MALEAGLFSGRPLCWKKLDITGDRIVPRSSHSATLVGDMLVVFGGYGGGVERHDFCHIHKDTLRCTAVNPTGPTGSSERSATARVGHSAYAA